MLYTEKIYRNLADRFNKNSFMGKLILIKNNPELFKIESDGTNLRLRLLDNEAMINGFDLYFQFPEFIEFEQIRDIFSLIDVKIDNLK
jgi:hypothetical protein